MYKCFNNYLNICYEFGYKFVKQNTLDLSGPLQLYNIHVMVHILCCSEISGLVKNKTVFYYFLN